ncbi:MAG: hypothetical protein RLZZ283_729 [Candidatus Parcubacteria bacterium]|jgi:hypothetical protein
MSIGSTGLENFVLSNGTRIRIAKPWEVKITRAWRPEPLSHDAERLEKARVIAARKRAESADQVTGQKPIRKS